MKNAGWVVLIYSLIVFIGGIFGHLKSASTASLICGIVFGVILFMSAIGMFHNKLFSAYAALISTFLLDAFFSYRFLLTWKFMPAGMMLFISLAALGAMVFFLRKDFDEQKKRL